MDVHRQVGLCTTAEKQDMCVLPDARQDSNTMRALIMKRPIFTEKFKKSGFYYVMVSVLFTLVLAITLIIVAQ